MMDDYSDMRVALDVQKALKDMIKANLITDKWNIFIGTKKGMKSTFDTTQVSDFLKFDFSFSEKIDPVYHGTCEKFLPEILRRGLRPSLIQNWSKGYTEDSDKKLYFTIDFDRAMYYAEVSAKKNKSKPVVLKITDLPIDYVTADDDFQTGSVNGISIMQILNAIRGGTKNLDLRNNYIRSIRNTAQFAYKGSVPAKNIKVVWPKDYENK